MSDRSSIDQSPIIEILRPYRRRMRVILVGRGVAKALLVGGIGFMLVLAARRLLAAEGLAGYDWQTTTVAAALFVAATGALIGAVRPLPWKLVAMRVDRAFGLSDATLSALQFCEEPRISSFQRLQVAETVKTLSAIRAPGRAAAWQDTRVLASGGLIWLVLLLAATVTTSRQQAVAATALERQQQVDQQHQELAAALEDSLMDELRRMAELTGSAGPDPRIPESLTPDLAQLRETARVEIQRLTQTGLTPREALASIGRIDDAMRATASELDAASREASFDQLAEALADSESTSPVADAIKDQQFDRAADELSEFQPEEMADELREPTADRLNQAADDLRERGQDDLGDAVQDLASGVNQDETAGKRGVDRLSDLLHQQQMMMNLGQKLEQQRLKLAEVRAMSQNGGYNIDRSERDKQTWGKGRAGDPVGEQVSDSVETSRQREELSGVLGEGESTREQFETDQLDGQANRPLQDSVRPNQQAIEAVLESESIPLGHRTTIRRYFKSIRPQQSSSTSNRNNTSR